jgi:hypothetical protein
MDNFSAFCDNDLTTNDPSFDICISAIQRFQNSRYQHRGGGANHGQPGGSPTDYLFAPVLGLVLLNNAAFVELFILYVAAGMYSIYLKVSKQAATVSRNSIKPAKAHGFLIPSLSLRYWPP